MAYILFCLYFAAFNFLEWPPRLNWVSTGLYSFLIYVCFKLCIYENDVGILILISAFFNQVFFKSRLVLLGYRLEGFYGV